MGRGELSPPLGACSGGGVVVLNSQMSWAPAEGASWPGLLLEVYGKGGGRCVFEVYRARQCGPHRSGPGGMLEVQGSGPSCLLWDGNPLRNTLIRLTC